MNPLLLNLAAQVGTRVLDQVLPAPGLRAAGAPGQGHDFQVLLDQAKPGAKSLASQALNQAVHQTLADLADFPSTRNLIAELRPGAELQLTQDPGGGLTFRTGEEQFVSLTPGDPAYPLAEQLKMQLKQIAELHRPNTGLSAPAGVSAGAPPESMSWVLSL